MNLGPPQAGAPPAEAWRLGRAFPSSQGEVTWDLFGSGPPVVLVHGTPSWSYLWRHVVPPLTGLHTVYVYDLSGFGRSEKRRGQDVSVAAQAIVLGELLDHWGLEEPAIAGHDIGAATVLRARLLHGRRFARIALLDAVAITPWITPFSLHVHRFLEAFETMPEHIHQELVAAHLQTAVWRKLDEAAIAPYLEPWLGDEGQAGYYRQVAQFDERHTQEMEPLYGTIDEPTLILWGAEDAWLPLAQGERLNRSIPGSELRIIPEAGHFVQEDRPTEVAAELRAFLAP